VRNARLPIVSISAVLEGVGSREDRDQPGLAALTAELIHEEARELADVRIATDTMTIQFVGESRLAETFVGRLGKMLRDPRIGEGDTARLRGIKRAEVYERAQRPRTIAAQIFDRVVFGAHPYATPADGTAESIGWLFTRDLRTFWERRYAIAPLTLIFAGDITVDVARRYARAALGDWDHRAAPFPAPPLPAYTPQLAFVDIPDAAQSIVLIGTRATAAGDPQQLAADVASAILGGGIGARLDRKLHEELALTIGASASFWRGRWAGSWAAATTFATDKTLPGVRAALDIIAGASTITADELARAKRDLLGAAQESFETNVGTVRAIERIVAQDLPRDWYATYAARLDALTLAEVQAAGQWRDLSVVIVGAWAKLGGQLGELGLPIVQYDRDGTQRP
jgi:zinc protease